MLFKGITILDENLEIQRNMFVGTRGDIVSYIGEEQPQENYGEVFDGKDRLLMSGFYNGHAHSPMALMRGYGENLALQDWLNIKIFPFEAQLDSESVYWGTMLCMAESLKYGIVSTTDMYYFVPDMVKAVTESGAKNNISRSIVNMTGESFDLLKSVEEMREAVRLYNGYADRRILIDASLHAEYTSDEATAKALAEYTRSENLRMHVHVSETKAEHEECKQRHGGKTPVAYLDSCGIFDVPAVAAHCVWIEDEDFDILKEKGVTVASNPCSNLKLASGICDTPKIIERGINLSIGTDSVASNNSLNFFEEMKLFTLMGKIKRGDPRAITPAEALKSATLGGALGQGRSDCGQLKVGNKADLIVVDLDVPNMQPIHSLVNNLVYSASADQIILTMVDGKVLYENGEFKTIDIEKTIYKVREATERILGKL